MLIVERSSNRNKREQLGISPGTARHHLVRSILFHYAVRLGENLCFRCKEAIETPDEMSIDHKVPWLYNGKELFYDLGNVCWSHKRCNKTDRPLRRSSTSGYSWCHACKRELKVEKFASKSSRWNGVDYECRRCKSGRMKKYYPWRKDRNGSAPATKRGAV